MNVVFNDVAELRSGKENQRIMVKVIRKWYQQSFSNAKLPLSLELVLMDVRVRYDLKYLISTDGERYVNLCVTFVG